MKGKKLVLHNKTDSEILFMIADSKIYATELAERYTFCGNNKDAVVMARQLKRIEKEGFLILDIGHEKNKKFYSINWEKIIEEFCEHIISQGAQITNKKNFIINAQKNFFVVSTFRNLFENIRQTIYHPHSTEERKRDYSFTIKELFRKIYEENLLWELNNFVDERINEDEEAEFFYLFCTTAHKFTHPPLYQLFIEQLPADVLEDYEERKKH